MAKKTLVQQVLDTAGKFVSGQKGQWGHEEWEKLVAEIEALGIEPSDETKRNLGNIIESCRHFQTMEPAPKTAKKRTPSRKKAAAKKSP